MRSAIQKFASKKKFSKKFPTKKFPSGYSALAAVFIMTTALILLAGVLDRGYAYVRRMRVESFAKAAASAGLSKLSEIIIETAKRRVIEDNLNPPENTNPVDILTPGDREKIIEKNGDVIEAALTIIDKNGQLNNTDVNRANAKVRFPYNFSLPCENYPRGAAAPIGIDVIIEEKTPTILAGFFWNVSSTRAAGRSTKVMRFCPR